MDTISRGIYKKVEEYIKRYMNKSPERQILINYLLGICTPNELNYVETWLDEDPENIQLLEQELRELNKWRPPQANKNRVKRSLDRIIDEDFFSISRQYSATAEKRKNSLTRRKSMYAGQWMVKALVVASVVIIATFFAQQYKTGQLEKAEAKPEITFQQRTLSNGQTSTFRFSDGSVINLNGGSTLRYPEHFGAERREVFLEGEAFFDIARDEARPFIVHTANTTTRVLGTSFNIKAYHDEDEMKVVVVEGKVQVNQKEFDTVPGSPPEEVILEKNQWAKYLNSGRLLEQGEGDIWEYVAWKDQVLVFNDKQFSEVARILERWYGVEIVLKEEDLRNTELKGEHKNVSLEQVLQSIQFVLGIEYTINDKVVTIQKPKK